MKKVVILGLLLFCLGVEAQEKEYVNAFKNKQLINAQTAVILRAWRGHNPLTQLLLDCDGHT